MVEMKKIKIPKIDERILEEWNKYNPKIGYDESKIPMKKRGFYGNYQLRDKLMEIITYLKNPLNICIVNGNDQKYFKQVEQEIIDRAWALVNLL